VVYYVYHGLTFRTLFAHTVHLHDTYESLNVISNGSLYGICFYHTNKN